MATLLSATSHSWSSNSTLSLTSPSPQNPCFHFPNYSNLYRIPSTSGYSLAFLTTSRKTLHFTFTHKPTSQFHKLGPRISPILNEIDHQDQHANDVGVKVALSILNFYKAEISPLLPKSCRYVPTCSDYSMIAYKKYGFVKGTVLTASRICRCNPLGGSGFDPPRWFDEEPAAKE